MRSLALVALLALPLAQASSGDRAKVYNDCVAWCDSSICSKPEYKDSVPLSLRLTLWSCLDECRYDCMHGITTKAIQTGSPVHQYHGKWPFWRVAGIQEPASMLFSAFNFLAHLKGARQIRSRIPDGHPMKHYYLWFALISMNAWVWSAVFHTRDKPTTEKLDYFSAALAILYGLFYTVIRVFHMYPTNPLRLTSDSTSRPKSTARNVWTKLCIVAYVAHVSYLTFLPRFDYAYNMAFNLVLGFAHNLLWLAFALPSSFTVFRRYPGRERAYRPSHANKAALLTLLTTACTGLELFDFPPWQRIIDAHSLWHLATAPIAALWYDFLVDDALDPGWRDARL